MYRNKLKILTIAFISVVMIEACDQKYISVPELPELDSFSFRISEKVNQGDTIGIIDVAKTDSCKYEFYLVEGEFSRMFSIDSTGVLTVSQPEKITYDESPEIDLEVMVMHNFQYESLALFTNVYIHLINEADTFNVVIDYSNDNTFDTYVSGLTPELNYNKSEYLMVEAWTKDLEEYISRSFIQFQLPVIPESSEVGQAVLYLYNPADSALNHEHSQLSGSNNLWFVPVEDGWQANSLNWDNQPTGFINERFEIPSSSTERQDYQIDVTNFIKSMYAKNENNCSWLIQLKTEEYYRRVCFASFDNKDISKRPKLEIKYYK